MIIVKQGVVFKNLQPQVVEALLPMHAAFQGANCDLIITSGSDGKHKPNSKHYTGEALDLRSSHVPAGERQFVLMRLRKVLGADWDVLLESDHYHAEYDPKT